MSDYWANRQARAQAKLTELSIKDTEAQLIKYYRSSAKRVIKEFENTYIKILNTVEAERAPTPADLYKLDTYWKMQGQLQRELQKLGDYQLKAMSKNFVNLYQNVYNSIAIKDDLFFHEADKKTAEQVINNIWCADGKSWSSRIWTNTAQLQETLNENLIHSVITGKKTSELKQLLQERFNVSFSNADSIVRTEMAHIQTQAAQQRYTDSGITQVQVWANTEERRCPKCADLHKKIYPVGAAMPVPVHPRCRCCIIPVIDD